jgi:hypothetical protein
MSFLASSSTPYGGSQIIQFHSDSNSHRKEIKTENSPTLGSALPRLHSLKRRSSFNEHGEEVPISPTPQANISLQIQDMNQIDKIFKLTLLELLQVDLKLILKAFIKIIEPHKQKNWPYRSKRKGDTEPPPWWPEDRKDNGELVIPYQEPDHLQKNHCQALAFHLMKWLMVDPRSLDYEGRFKGRPAAFVQKEFKRANLQLPDGDSDDQKGKKRRECLDQLFTIAVNYEQFRREEIGKWKL